MRLSTKLISSVVLPLNIGPIISVREPHVVSLSSLIVLDFFLIYFSEQHCIAVDFMCVKKNITARDAHGDMAGEASEILKKLERSERALRDARLQKELYEMLRDSHERDFSSPSECTCPQQSFEVYKVRAPVRFDVDKMFGYRTDTALSAQSHSRVICELLETAHNSKTSVVRTYPDRKYKEACEQNGDSLKPLMQSSLGKFYADSERRHELGRKRVLRLWDSDRYLVMFYFNNPPKSPVRSDVPALGVIGDNGGDVENDALSEEHDADRDGNVHNSRKRQRAETDYDRAPASQSAKCQRGNGRTKMIVTFDDGERLSFSRAVHTITFEQSDL